MPVSPQEFKAQGLDREKAACHQEAERETLPID
jgi:hypothetical protein